jgi:hypothetical protein
MDLVNVVVFGNCTIALVVTILTVWTIQFRKQVVAVGEWCERWDRECERWGASNVTESLAPQLGSKLAASRSNILYLRQFYRQQLQTLDRLQSVRLVFGLGRSLLLRRRG